MTLTTALIISAFIFSITSLILVSSKKSYNFFHRRKLKTKEIKLASKLEKMKNKNTKFYRISKKLAKIRMRLNKFQVASLSETVDPASFTRGQRKKYFKYNRQNHKLQSYREQMKGHIIKENKRKETKLRESVAKYEKKLPFEHAAKVMPGTFLDTGNGIIDTRTGIHLGLANKAQEEAFIANARELIRTSHRYKTDKERSFAVRIESADSKIDGLGISSSYKRICKMGEEEVLKVVNQEKTPESFPIVVNKMVKNMFGRVVETDPVRLKNEKEFAEYLANYETKTPAPELTK